MTATLKYRGVEAKVVKAEYLAAIALQTGRAKDRERVIRILEEAEIDRGRSGPRSSKKHGLAGKAENSRKAACMKSKSAERVFEQKRERRRQLARLPFEKKIEIVVELQKAAAGDPERSTPYHLASLRLQREQPR